MDKGAWQSAAREVTELDTTWRLNSNKISYCAWAISCSGSLVQLIFQTRILEWVAISYSKKIYKLQGIFLIQGWLHLLHGQVD